MLFDYPALQSWEDPHAAEIVARNTLTEVLTRLNALALAQPCDDPDVMRRDVERHDALFAAIASFA